MYFIEKTLTTIIYFNKVKCENKLTFYLFFFGVVNDAKRLRHSFI